MEDVVGSAHTVTYQLELPCALDISDLSALLPQATFAFDESTGLLTCRRPISEGNISGLNATLLGHLLQQNVGILGIRPGARLEDAYLEQSTPEARPGSAST